MGEVKVPRNCYTSDANERCVELLERLTRKPHRLYCYDAEPPAGSFCEVRRFSCEPGQSYYHKDDAKACVESLNRIHGGSYHVVEKTYPNRSWIVRLFKKLFGINYTVAKK